MRISTAFCPSGLPPLPLLAFPSPSVSFRGLPASMLPFLYLLSFLLLKTLLLSLLPRLPVSPGVFALLLPPPLPPPPVVVRARAGVPALFAAPSFSPGQLMRSE